MRHLLLFCLVAIIGGATASPVQTVLLADFESGTPIVSEVNQTNSSAIDRAYSDAGVVSETGSKRLRMTDPGGFRNGIVLTLPNAIVEPGYFLITADIKVVNSAAAPISTFGIAAKLGPPTSSKVLDVNAGYVMNLEDYPTNAATLGYQTVGAAIQVPAGGTFPQSLTLYFSTDPSGSTANDDKGDFVGPHRGSGPAFPIVTNTNAIYIDNIKRIGPGNYGEERHAWISVSDSMTNLTSLRNHIDQAFANGFNCIDVLVRYRANHYYTPNRDIFTTPNPEPYVNGTSAANDPVQAAIDRAHELGMRVYGSFSAFLVTDGSNNYPSYLPANSRTYVYNGSGVAPVLQTTAHDSSGLWADPALTSVQTYTRNIVIDLITNYDLDGIIFDRIRYQGSSFGYNPQAMAEMGFDFNNPPAPTNTAWVEARQNRLAKFLNDVYNDITDRKPWMIVGTVPIAYSTGMNDTYNGVMQSWPKWSQQTPGNRTITFGAQDLIQPQFYRQWNSGGNNNAPVANQTLMRKALYGDTAADPMDYGLMPGNLTNVAPLFATLDITGPEDAQNTAAALAQNICDTQSMFPMNGSGIFSARGLFTDNTGLPQKMIQLIRAASTVPCGSDVMASSAPLSDFLMKAGWDNTPPLAVGNLSVTTNGYFADLSWTPPAPAADGETASRYLIYYSTSSDVKEYYANLSSPGETITGTTHQVGPFSSSASYYFRVVPVDDYNNKGPSTVVGPVAVMGGNFIVETHTASGALNNQPPSAPPYSETIAMQNTSSKSTLPELAASTARYTATVGTVATFTPNLPIGGVYNIYVTMGSGSNNNALARYTIKNTGADIIGQVNLSHTNTALVNKWLLLASNVNLDAGRNGSVSFENLTGNSGNGNRFVMDAVRFELVTSSVEDWQLY